MTPIATLSRGDYKLRALVQNPEGCARADDWRLKDMWHTGTKFHCFEVYTFSGRTVHALYIDRPALMVHESCMPGVFHLLLPYLERV